MSIKRSIPFRNNPKIKTNWFNPVTKVDGNVKTKRSYYSISYDKGLLKVQFREEKKRRGTGKVESNWYGTLEFQLDGQFGKDLKMFFDEYSKVKNNRKKRKK